MIKLWAWALVAVAVCYLALAAWMYVSQDRMLFPAATFTADYANVQASREGLAPWPAGAPVARGYLTDATTSATVGTVIVFHGNAGSALDRTYYPVVLNGLGYRVLLAEYPGYGSRPGQLGERSFVPDALETFDRVRVQFGEPLYVIGESLGAGVASAVVRDRGQSVAGVALITPWDSLPDLVQATYPLLPARLLVRSRFDNMTNLATYGGPKVVAMALEDEVVPNTHTRRLYDSLGQPKRLWEIEGAGHNTWPSVVGPGWWRGLVTYWASGGLEK